MPRGVSRYDEARVQRRLWTPEAIRGAMVGWWDVSHLPSLTISSGALSDIADRSGKGLTLSQSTAGSRPTYTASRQCATFDGSGDEMSTAQWSSASEGEVIVAGIWTNTASRLQGTFGLNGRNFYGALATGGATANWDCGSNSGAPRIAGTYDSAWGTPQVWSFLNSASRNVQVMRLNGETIGSDATGHGVTISGGMWWGSYWSGSFTHQGDFHEWMVLRGSSDFLVTWVEGYLWNKWRQSLVTLKPLAGTHPYRNAPPLI